MDSNMNKSKPRALLVGHVAKDLREGNEMQGGPPLYQIPILVSFGFSVDLITSCSSDYFIPHLPGLTVYRLVSENTTTFEFQPPKHTKNQFSNDDRVLILRERAFDLKLPEKLELDPKYYDVVIFSGIAQEISLKLIDQISTNLNSPIIAIDMQTIVRKASVGTAVTTKKDGELLIQLLEYCNLIKGSQVEIDDLKKVYERLKESQLKKSNKKIIRTASGDPIQIIFNVMYQDIEVEKIPTNQIVDATGSGDIFLASLIASWYRDNDFRASIYIAHQITKDFLLIQGPPTLEQSAEIIEKYI